MHKDLLSSIIKYFDWLNSILIKIIQKIRVSFELFWQKFLAKASQFLKSVNQQVKKRAKFFQIKIKKFKKKVVKLFQKKEELLKQLLNWRYKKFEIKASKVTHGKIFQKKPSYLKQNFKYIRRNIKQKFFVLFKFKQQLIKFLPSILTPELKRLYLSLLSAALILGASWSIYQNIFVDLPSPRTLTEEKQALTTRILDRNGKLLYRIYQDENRTLISLEDVSQDMINATLAIEDRDFYQHYGFSPRGIFRALFHNLRQDRVQGGSTITQQLVKNRLLGPEKTLKRKIKELILAVLVEVAYSKQEILEMYLNEVSYGGSTYGVEEASWRFFNKPAKDLTLAESALLAGLPAAPSIYNPFGSNPELSYRRQEEVLRRMVEDDYLSLEDAYQANQEKLTFNPDVINIEAPHFVMYVRKLLAEKFGEQMVNQGGLEVRTSLDLSLQQQAQEIVTEQVDQLARLNVNNGAALVVNPQTGEILTMVGSRNYFDFEQDGQVNVTLRPRQPGSAIKPLTYALAFELGRNPWDFIDDAPITYHIPGSRPYTPRNYDGRFQGRVTLRQALAGSLNIPAVKVLASIGVDNLVAKGQEMGISTWTDSNRFGLSLTLGAGEVLMVDLAEVFGTFATGGYSVDLDPFLEIRDQEGKILYRNQCFIDNEFCQQFRTLDKIAAYQINDILSDNNARATTFGYHSLLNIPQQQVAVKTGTSNDRRDNWAMGYTTDRLVGAWVGNNDNIPMSRVASGMTGASPIWNQIMRLLLDSNNPHFFILPEDLIKVKICVPTNTLACPECPLITEEIFERGQEPTQACNWRYFTDDEEEL